MLFFLLICLVSRIRLLNEASTFLNNLIGILINFVFWEDKAGHCMFRFIREFRKNLLGNGQVRRYVFYAVGEIALVVIGILLALQIDSWKTERIQRKKELLYLQEIYANLDDDLENVIYSLDFNHRKDSIIQVCLTAILEEQSDAEIMMAIFGNMPVLAEFSVYTQNRVAFDNMLSAENIDLISNDSLRTHISSFYSEDNLLFGMQDRVKELTRLFVDKTTPLLMNRESINLIFGKPNQFAPAEDLDFRKNRILFGDLFGMQRNLGFHTEYLQAYRREILSLREEIDRFLGSAR